MADQIEVSKVTSFAAVGPPAGHISASKVVMFVVLEPGDDGSGGADISTRQGFCYGQRVGRG
jgi:hypothetical protein